MKMKLALTALAVMTTACGSPVPPPQTAPVMAQATTTSVNPVGRFEFTTAVQGQPVNGVMNISGSPGMYGGEITTNVTPPLPITAVTVEGNGVAISSSTPDGPLTIRTTFTDANTFTGTWELAGDSGSLSGRRAM